MRCQLLVDEMRGGRAGLVVAADRRRAGRHTPVGACQVRRTPQMSKPSRGHDRYHPWATHIYARQEARSRGDRKIGSEHLVLGLLREPTIAQTLGCDLDSARATLACLDRDALAGVGLSTGLQAPPIPVREDEFPVKPTIRAVLRDRMPLTPAAKAALRSSRHAMRRNEREAAQRAVLVALLELLPPDPAAVLFAALGVDRSGVLARVERRAEGCVAGSRAAALLGPADEDRITGTTVQTLCRLREVLWRRCHGRSRTTRGRSRCTSSWWGRRMNRSARSTSTVASSARANEPRYPEHGAKITAVFGRSSERSQRVVMSINRGERPPSTPARCPACGQPEGARPDLLCGAHRRGPRGDDRNRTGVNGFAGRCVATPPRRREAAEAYRRKDRSASTPTASGRVDDAGGSRLATTRLRQAAD